MKSVCNRIVGCLQHGIDSDKLAEGMSIIEEEFGKTIMLSELLGILQRTEFRNLWPAGITVMCWNCDGISPVGFDSPDIVPTLYNCLEDYGGDPECKFGDLSNLVWTITCTVLEISYQSDWNPIGEPAIANRMKELRSLQRRHSENDGSSG